MFNSSVLNCIQLHFHQHCLTIYLQPFLISKYSLPFLLYLLPKHLLILVKILCHLLTQPFIWTQFCIMHIPLSLNFPFPVRLISSLIFPLELNFLCMPLFPYNYIWMFTPIFPFLTPPSSLLIPHTSAHPTTQLLKSRHSSSVSPSSLIKLLQIKTSTK